MNEQLFYEYWELFYFDIFFTTACNPCTWDAQIETLFHYKIPCVRQTSMKNLSDIVWCRIEMCMGMIMFGN